MRQRSLSSVAVASRTSARWARSWVAALAVAISWVPGPAARATILLEQSIEEMTAESALVVRARVARVDPRMGGPNGRPGIYTYVTLDVIEHLRGTSGARVEVVVHGGRVGREASLVSGQARFTAGEEVVVFLFRGGGALWPTAMALGKWAVQRDARGEWVTRSFAGVGLARPAADGTVRPVAPSETRAPSRMSLDELRDRVRSVP